MKERETGQGAAKVGRLALVVGLCRQSCASWARSWWWSARRMLQVTWAIIRRHPSTLVVPVLMLGIMLGVGLWGVHWGADRYDQQAHKQAQEYADAYLANYQRKMQQITILPSILLATIRRNPAKWEGLNQTLQDMIPDILAMPGVREYPPGMAITAPQGRVAGVYISPFFPPLDLLDPNDPVTRIGSLSLLKHRGYALAGPSASQVPTPNPAYDAANPTAQPEFLMKNVLQILYIKAVFVPPPAPNVTLPYDVPLASNCTEMCTTPDGETFWGFVGAFSVIDDFISAENFNAAGYRFRVTAPNRDPNSKDITSEADLWAEILITQSQEQVEDPVHSRVVMDDTDSQWTLYLSPVSGTWRPSWEVPMIIVVVIVSVALAAMQFIALLMWRQHGMLLESILPENVLQQLHKEHNFGASYKDFESTMLGTPAETMLRVLGCTLQGDAPDLRDVVLVRTTLMRAADIYRPLDLTAKIKAASGLDSDVAKALARELDGNAIFGQDRSTVGDMDYQQMSFTIARDSEENHFATMRSALAAITLPSVVPTGDELMSTLMDSNDNIVRKGQHANHDPVDMQSALDTGGSDWWGRAPPLAAVRAASTLSLLSRPAPVGTMDAADHLAQETTQPDTGSSPRPLRSLTKNAGSMPRQMHLDQLERQLAGTGEWGFDTMELAVTSNGRPLSTLGFYLLSSTGLMDTFKLKGAVVARYLCKVESLYVDNAYHSATHAASVLQSMHVLLQRGGLAGAYADPLGQLACYFAAVVHDLGHPGRTNDFLINTSHDLALRYNDKAPLENHHVAQAFDLLRQPGMNFLSSLTRDQRTKLRRLVIELVLITDMKQHFSLVSQFKTLHAAAIASNQEPRRSSISRGTPLSSGHRMPHQHGAGGHRPVTAATAAQGPEMDENGKLMTLQMALKCADLGHLSSPLPLHLRWVAGLEEEYFKQGDAEKAAGLPISPLFDRGKPGITKSQVGFFNIVVLPLFHSLAAALPTMQPLRQAVDANFQYWQELERQRVVAAALSAVPGASAAAAAASAAPNPAPGGGEGAARVQVEVAKVVQN